MSCLLALDEHGNPTGWADGLGVGLAFFGAFAGMALLVWAYSKWGN
jgi:hypothetical protein